MSKLLTIQVPSAKSHFHPVCAWQLGPVTFSSVSAPVNVVARKGVLWLDSDSPSVREHRALRGRGGEGRTRCASQHQVFLQQTLLTVVDRGEGRRWEKFAWMRNTRRQCIARNISLSTKRLILGISVRCHVHRTHFFNFLICSFFCVFFLKLRQSGSFSKSRLHSLLE